MTEHVIWNGPGWASQVLEMFAAEREKALEPREGSRFNATLVREGVWKGSCEEGVRIAANGVAHLLSQERREKIQQEKAIDRTDAVPIT